MKKIIVFSWLILVFFGQRVVGQSIIMGSMPLVADIEDTPRYFYDPGGIPGDLGENQDPQGFYAQNLRDTMTLSTAMNGTVMYIHFEAFVMGIGDTLFIFDGANCNSTLIGAYHLVQSPGEIFATTNALTFVFHSDNQDMLGFQEGWRALVYAYDTLPSEIIFGTGSSNHTCNAYFYDSGGPNGNIASNNENLITQFTSSMGSHIKCEFEEFSVNGVLKIYDGLYNDTNKRLIGQFCTSTLDNTTNNMPPVLFSSSSSLTFEYAGATNDVNMAGWKAHISCFSELMDYPDSAIIPSITNHVVGINSDSVPDSHTVIFEGTSNNVILVANVDVPYGQYTNDYLVEQIPFESHVFGFTEGTPYNSTSEDRWLDTIDLPFTFNFFGISYSAVYPSTNGLISLNPRSGLCAYSYGNPPSSPPYTTNIPGNQSINGSSYKMPYNYNNCIYGIYEDIDCLYYNAYSFETIGAMRSGVIGEAPHRAFVFNYLNIGLYGNHNDPSHYNTYQMVLYEGSNIIDIYVKHRACCAATNSHGEGIIGLQNSTSSQILIAPGRNMTGWEADDEAWRFTPISPKAEGELTWYANTVSQNTIVGHGRSLVVNPDTTTAYISEYRCVNASGAEYVFRDTTSIIIHQMIDSTSVVSRQKDFVVYPNPTHDMVYVKMLNMQNFPKRIEVLNMQGKPLFAVPAEETTRVDLSRLPSGVYFLSLEGCSRNAVKIVKE